MSTTNKFIIHGLVLFILTSCSSSNNDNSKQEELEVQEEVAEELTEEVVSDVPEEAAVSYYAEFIDWVEINHGKQAVIPSKYFEYVENVDDLMPVAVKRSTRNGSKADAVVFRKKEISPESNFHMMLAYYENEQLYDNQFLKVPDVQCFPGISFVSDSKDPVVEIIDSPCAVTAGKKTYLNIEGTEWVYNFIDVEHIDLEENLSLVGSIFLNMPALPGSDDAKKRALLYELNPYARQLRKKGAYGIFNVYDPGNGYLNFMPGFEVPVEYELTFSMTYWNLSNGKKLVGFARMGCDMNCKMEEFKFFSTEDGKTFEKLDKSAILPDLESASFLEDAEQDAECFYLNLIYELPRNGQDIRAYVEEDCPVPLKGNEVMLKWNGVSFDLGKFKKVQG